MIINNCFYDVKYITRYINYYTTKFQMVGLKERLEERLKRIPMMTRKK